MRFYPVSGECGSEVPEERLRQDYASAHTIGKLRIGGEALFFRAGLKTFIYRIYKLNGVSAAYGLYRPGCAASGEIWPWRAWSSVMRIQSWLIFRCPAKRQERLPWRN